MFKTKSTQNKNLIKFSLSFVATIFMVVFSLGLAGPASAAPSHEGTDPQNTGCGNDAYTITKVNLITVTTSSGAGSAAANALLLASLPDNSRYYEVRYSPSCQTNWIRYQVPPGWNAVFNIKGPNSPSSGITNSSGGYVGNYWTDQVYAPGTACIDTYLRIDPQGGNGDVYAFKKDQFC